MAERLRGVDVVVHLAIDLDLETDAAARTAYNVRGAQTVLTAAAAAGVHRVVLCTSAMVYGAQPDNPVPLAEDAPLRATEEATGVGDFLEIERLARRAPRAHPAFRHGLRPAVLVGAGIDTVVTRHFEAPRLLVVKGPPCWQFCHVDDLAAGLDTRRSGDVDGELAVGCDGWLEQEEVEEISGIRRMELPPRGLGAAARLHRLGVTPAPATDLRVHDVPVGGLAALHGAGWRPRWTTTRSSPCSSRRSRAVTPWSAAGSAARSDHGDRRGRHRRGDRHRRDRPPGPQTPRADFGPPSATGAPPVASAVAGFVACGTMGPVGRRTRRPGEQPAQDPIRLLADP